MGVRCDNLVYIDAKEAFFLIKLPDAEEKELMEGLRALGIEAKGEIVYCG
jgi:hypothetical protein